MKIIFLSILGLLLMTNCTKKISLNEVTTTPKIVINGLFESGKQFRIHTSSTARILDNEIPIVEDATIELWRDNEFIEFLTYQNDGWYISTITAQENHQYGVKAYTSELDTVWAEDALPSKIFIQDGCFSKEDNSEWGQLTVFSFTLQDKANEKNYYEVQFCNASYFEDIDSSEIRSYLLESADIVLEQDSDLELYPSAYYFSDDLINGQAYTMTARGGVGGRSTFMIKGKIGIPKEFGEPNYCVLLNSVSEEYYKFGTSWQKHAFFQSDGERAEDVEDLILGGEPSQLYTNVQGGYGIFAGFASDLEEVKAK